MCENSVMIFPIKKRISVELFIYRNAALYVGETRIRVVTNEGDQLIGGPVQKCYLDIKGVGIKN